MNSRDRGLDSERTDPKDGVPDRGYALSGKIMLSAIVILFFVVILMVCLHLYARWYIIRARRRQMRRARNRRPTHLMFYVDPSNPNATNVTARGLDANVLKSLPVFVYSSETHLDPMDCAVCLSEFEEKEMGRTLPKCNHSFHVGCIDMWFHSHSTCPLCRSPVEPLPENSVQVISSSEAAGTGSSSCLCDTCQQEESDVRASTSSFEGQRKPVGLSVTIDITRRNGNFEDESGTESSTSHAFRSPIGRVLSFKRILSRERRPIVPPSPSNGAGSGGFAAEVDIERGRDHEQRNQS